MRFKAAPIRRQATTFWSMSQAMAIVWAGMGMRLKAPQKSRQPSRAAALMIPTSIRNPYFLTKYTRSPASVFVDSILRPCFLAAVERKPLTLWACQFVVVKISNTQPTEFDKPQPRPRRRATINCRG